MLILFVANADTIVILLFFFFVWIFCQSLFVSKIKNEI